MYEELESMQGNTNEEFDFTREFENSLTGLTSGTVAKGTVIAIGNSEVYVDLGYKSDGIIAKEEFTEGLEAGAPFPVKIGDEVEAYVVRVNDKDGIVQLSKRLAEAARTRETVKESFKSGEPVKVKVTDVVKGGVLALASGLKIFIPASQLGTRYVEDPKQFMGKVFEIKIIEVNEKNNRMVGSRRAILEKENEEKAKGLWENIEVGKQYEGTVTSLKDYGAFVNIGGAEGLAHVSQLSWSKVKHPSDILKVGDTVLAKVTELDREKGKISLSLKKDEDNPWNSVASTYREGDFVEAKVARIVPFGAFLELKGGVDGLLHSSQVVKSELPTGNLKEGQLLKVMITKIDTETKKISLSMKDSSLEEPVQENESKSEDKPE